MIFKHGNGWEKALFTVTYQDTSYCIVCDKHTATRPKQACPMQGRYDGHHINPASTGELLDKTISNEYIANCPTCSSNVMFSMHEFLTFPLFLWLQWPRDKPGFLAMKPRLDLEVIIQGVLHDLVGIIYHEREHYWSELKKHSTWYFYDGLDEHFKKERKKSHPKIAQESEPTGKPFPAGICSELRGTTALEG